MKKPACTNPLHLKEWHLGCFLLWGHLSYNRLRRGGRGKQRDKNMNVVSLEHCSPLLEAVLCVRISRVWTGQAVPWRGQRGALSLFPVTGQAHPPGRIPPGYGQPSGISDTAFSSASPWGDTALHCSPVTPGTLRYSFTHLCAGTGEKQNSTWSTTLRINSWHECQLTLYSPFHPYPISTPTYFPFLLSKLHFSSVLLFFVLCVLYFPSFLPFWAICALFITACG